MKQQTVGSLIEALGKFPREFKIMVATDDEGNDYRYLHDNPTFGHKSEYGDTSCQIFDDITGEPSE